MYESLLPPVIPRMVVKAYVINNEMYEYLNTLNNDNNASFAFRILVNEYAEQVSKGKYPKLPSQVKSKSPARTTTIRVPVKMIEFLEAMSTRHADVSDLVRKIILADMVKKVKGGSHANK